MNILLIHVVVRTEMQICCGEYISHTTRHSDRQKKICSADTQSFLYRIAHTCVHKNVSREMHRSIGGHNRQNDIYKSDVLLPSHSISKRHSKDINWDKKKWQYFRHYLLNGTIIAIFDVFATFRVFTISVIIFAMK